eukprot:3471021-Pyramimonas_sp.AAC.1
MAPPCGTVCTSSHWVRLLLTVSSMCWSKEATCFPARVKNLYIACAVDANECKCHPAGPTCVGQSGLRYSMGYPASANQGLDTSA